ncbi:MAG: S46 family peptidase [Ignavibacteriaceae bacterium]
MRIKKSVLPNLLLLTISTFIFFGSTPPDEGMYPLSEISKLDLKKAGLKMEIKDLYNPNGVSLIDALVSLQGCTGSFVSKEGLILTNHHCAFDYIRKASTLEKNFLEDGFLAKTREEEIEARGQICKITESYRDVSDEILAAANESKDVAERMSLIRKKIKQLVDDEKAKDPGSEAEVSEMFIGKTYILFKYRVLRDVRLVYAPPRTIGEFGGESDNWVWPRHTGDFTFLRAYVAPDGSPATYSEKNIPYTPKRFLKVNPNGVEENDFMFILGYPGRTFRHQPSQYTRFHEEYQLPYIQNIFGELIDVYNKLGSNNLTLALKLSSRIKSLANTEKNYRGKIQGLRRLSLVDKRETEERALQKFIDSDIQLKKEYSNVLNEIDEIYKEIFDFGRIGLMYTQLSRNPLVRLNDLLFEYRREMEKPEEERAAGVRGERLLNFHNVIKDLFNDLDKEVEAITLSTILTDARRFPEMRKLETLKDLFEKEESPEEIAKYIRDLVESSIIKDYDSYKELLEMDQDDFSKIEDPMAEFLSYLKREYLPIQNKTDVINGKLNISLAKLIDVKKLWQQRSFIPDANSTLRLTYGYIKGYTPADATYYKPITTLSGLIEKSYLGEDYRIPKKLKELYDKKDFGRYKNEKLNDVPVAILYNSDTTGGNSGSPIMNAYGELIGVNFDRSYEATINDYAWSENYSRSIGVDIRFVLWVTEKIGEAHNVISELGIN